MGSQWNCWRSWCELDWTDCGTKPDQRRRRN